MTVCLQLYKERHENILKIFNKITSQENCTQVRLSCGTISSMCF